MGDKRFVNQGGKNVEAKIKSFVAQRGGLEHKNFSQSGISQI